METRAIQGQKVGSSVRSGAIAGALAALAFAIIHDIFISDIWFSLIMMMGAGAICGLCIGWSYALLTEVPSTGSWWRYNMLYVALLILLGITSVLVFEPTTTMAALVAANAPPDKLIGQALPMTALFTLLAAVLISLLYRQSWRHFGVVLLTYTLLILLLGLNVSVIGLVSIPRGSLYLVVEFFGLILAINVVYAALFTALERKRLRSRGAVELRV
jgi:MFS family permease